MIAGSPLDRRQEQTLRIALMIYGDISQKSGGFLYDRELVRGLQELGCMVDILSMPWPGELEVKPMVSLPTSMPRSSTESSAVVHNSGSWERARTKPYDILLQDELCHQELADFNRQPRQYQGKIVSIVHNLAYRSCKREEKNEIFRREKEYLQTVDGVIANSCFTSRTVAEILLSEIPTVVAYPSLGIDPQSWPSLLNSETENVELSQYKTVETVKFISVGNVTRVKQFHQLLESLGVISRESRNCWGGDTRPSLKIQTWSLTIVGDVVRDSNYVKQLEQVIDRYQIHQQVGFTGHLEGRELANAYREADVMVLATHEEGFGIACLEALAFGLPTIASRKGAASEIVSDGVDGILFDPNQRSGPGSLLETLKMWIPASESSFARIARRIREFGQNAERNARCFSGWPRTASNVFDFLVRVQNSRT